jgi:hypothetical protein
MVGTLKMIREENALPTLLESSLQQHFSHRVEKNAFGMPSGITIAELKALSWTLPESPSFVAKTKPPNAKPQPSAAEQAPPEATPTLQSTHDNPRRPSFEALQQTIEALPCGQGAKQKTLNGSHPERGSSKPQLSKAEKEFMAAVCRNDLKRVEKLLSESGPSLMSSFGSDAILHFARNNLNSSWSQSNKMCELLLAQGDVPVWKKGCDVNKGGLVTHAGKEGRTQLSFERDFTKLHTKEKQAAPWQCCSVTDSCHQAALSCLGRSSSVPHIWANISNPVTAPKRSSSNARIRRKPIYQTHA